MSTSKQFVSACFTVLPAVIFFGLFLLTGWVGREYWWGTYFAVLTVLLLSSLLLGFVLPTIFQRLRIHQPWIWILMQGVLAWIIAVAVLGFLNMTPLCVDQDNGDGNNDFGMCMFMTALSGIVYTPLYLGLLTISSLIGHWLLRIQNSSYGRRINS